MRRARGKEDTGEAPEGLRIDRWLWAARFFKTRALAAKAVIGGKVKLNGVRAKPARTVRIGDLLQISREPFEYDVVVRAIPKRRGPSTEASALYRETDDSARRRAELDDQLKVVSRSIPRPARRPDKRGRRQILRLTRSDR